MVGHQRQRRNPALRGSSSFRRSSRKKFPKSSASKPSSRFRFPLDDVEWSYQLFQTPESPDVEVGIFAMRKELINQHIKFFTDVDLNVQVVQMNPLAVYNAMYHDNRIEGTTMIIDLGAENTDLIIADGETIWLRSIPIGGNNFTEALVKASSCNFTKAEDLKRNATTSKYARQIFQAMRPVFADLVAEIQRIDRLLCFGASRFADQEGRWPWAAHSGCRDCRNIFSRICNWMSRSSTS